MNGGSLRAACSFGSVTPAAFYRTIFGFSNLPASCLLSR